MMSKLKGALSSGRSGPVITTEHRKPLQWGDGDDNVPTDEQNRCWEHLRGALSKTIRFFPEHLPCSFLFYETLSFPPNQKVIAYRHEVDLPLKTDKDGFALTLDRFVTVRFLIEVNFLDLKMADGSDRGSVSVWPSFATKLDHQGKRSKFARMQQEGIRTDIIINTADGSIRAHSSVLAARSPVFQSMSSHNLKEKRHSSVDISDMLIDECQAFMNYLSGDLQGTEFAAHRVALLGAAEKYDLPDLKIGCVLGILGTHGSPLRRSMGTQNTQTPTPSCVDSLFHDIDTENLIESLQVAHLYQLPDLKTRCIRLLVDFQKIYEIHDDFIEFVRTGDRDLVAEVMQAVLARLGGLF
ncbi:hypothetical protein ACP70R_006200 [Stipagrostis hirtigluma subsp. patula]